MGREGERFREMGGGQRVSDAVEGSERRMERRKSLGLSAGRFMDLFCENSCERVVAMAGLP